MVFGLFQAALIPTDMVFTPRSGRAPDSVAWLKANWKRVLSVVAGVALLLGLLYVVIGAILLAAHVDIYCNAYTLTSLDCGEHGRCEAGACSCEEEWAGPDCTACQTGWGGDDCTTCTRACSGHGTCDDATHTCQCETGWGGPDCTVCTKACSAHGACDDTKGLCHCETDWGGSNCTTCTRTCSGHGTCDNTTSLCLCQSGWGGEDCTTCTKTCSGHAHLPLPDRIRRPRLLKQPVGSLSGLAHPDQRDLGRGPERLGGESEGSEVDALLLLLH